MGGQNASGGPNHAGSGERFQQVWITGIGVVTPLGSTNARYRDALLAGRSGVGAISLFDAGGLPTRFAAEVAVDPASSILPDRKIGFALDATRSAVSDALARGGGVLDGALGGLSFGIGLELFDMADLVRHLAAERLGRVDPVLAQKHPLTRLQTPSDLCLHLIAREFGLCRPPLTHVSACAASTDALGAAWKQIRRGACQWMIAGGADSMINPLGFGGFTRLRALSQRNDEPQQASRPFDAGRDGFVMGEGAASLVLESETHARARGARPYAELIGYGNAFDAHGISEPHPEGQGALNAMQRALAAAGVTAEQVVHINAHGTSTPKNDVIETLAIRRLLGAQADSVTVSATKSMIGHLISASGAAEVAAMLLCAEAGYWHGTINLATADAACDLDYLEEGKRRCVSGVYLKNSFGFGGQNAVLALRVS